MRPRGDSDLEARDPVGRAVRQAQPARHARHQLVLVDRQDAESRCSSIGMHGGDRCVEVRHGHPPPRHRREGERPAAGLAPACRRGRTRRVPVPSGGDSALTAPKASRPGAPASRSIQPPAASAARRRARDRSLGIGGDVHRADTDLRQPADADEIERGAHGAECRRTHRHAAPVRAGGPRGWVGDRGPRGAGRVAPRCRRGTPSSSTRVVVPSQVMHDGRYSAATHLGRFEPRWRSTATRPEAAGTGGSPAPARRSCPTNRPAAAGDRSR